MDVYTHSRAQGFGKETIRRVMLGTYALSAGYYDAYYLKAQKVRRLISQDFDNAFNDVDVVVGPTTPMPAFKIGERTADPLSMYLADVYTVGVNLAGLPGISLPAGNVVRDGRHLPVGFQLVGHRSGDYQLLSIAKEVETLFRHSHAV